MIAWDSSKLVQDTNREKECVIEFLLAAFPCKKLSAWRGEKSCACSLDSGPSILLLEEQLAATSDGTSSLGGDETAFLTAGGVSSCRGWVTDVLMVTTTVGMLDGVHGDTSNSGPVSLLCV